MQAMLKSKVFWIAVAILAIAIIFGPKKSAPSGWTPAQQNTACSQVRTEIRYDIAYGLSTTNDTSYLEEHCS